MFNRFVPFLYENKILTEAQNCLRKGKCIETAVQSFIEKIQKALDKGFHLIGIFIDVTKPMIHCIIKYYWKYYHPME
jgi:hypothetical protein